MGYKIAKFWILLQTVSLDIPIHFVCEVPFIKLLLSLDIVW